MNYKKLCIGLLLLFIFGISEVNAIVCYYGRAGCVPACIVQNCATGYCSAPPRDGAIGTCVCSRCGIGGYKPF